jgi:PAS domain S-box-containing protein
MGVARAKSSYTLDLIDEELSLRALVDASHDAIIGKTLDGIIVSWNNGADKIYGYKAEEVLGGPITVLIPPSHPNEFPEIMMRLRRGEYIENFETKRIHKDGHVIDVSVTISPVKCKNGTVVGASVVARDITEQKQTQNALRQSEERFRVALKNAPVVVFSQDLQLRYTWINSPYLFPRENFLGRTDAEVFGGEDGARLMAIKEQVLRTERESHTEVTVSVNGVTHYFDLVVEPLLDPSGKLLGLLCSAIETTFLKETIIRLQNALNEVQVLEGLLPICANCKRIRDQRGTWQVLEVFLQAHSEAKFSHGICPDCLRKLYPEQYRKWGKHGA